MTHICWRQWRLSEVAVTLLSVISSGAIAVPLCPEFPPSELAFVLDNSRTRLFLSSDKFQSKGRAVLDEPLPRRPHFHVTEKRLQGSTKSVGSSDGSQHEDQGGLMLYTSGTTSRPVSCPRLLLLCCRLTHL